MTTKHSHSTNDWQAYMHQLEEVLQLYLVDKAPAIPKEGRETIVKIAPWITLILMLVALPVILAGLGISALFAPVGFLAGYQMGLLGIISLVIVAVSIVLEALAIPGLFNKTKQGWNYVYYATLLGGVDSILHFNLAGLLIGTGLGLYILFQIKEYYR